MLSFSVLFPILFLYPYLVGIGCHVTACNGEHWIYCFVITCIIVADFGISEIAAHRPPHRITWNSDVINYARTWLQSFGWRIYISVRNMQNHGSFSKACVVLHIAYRYIYIYTSTKWLVSHSGIIKIVQKLSVGKLFVAKLVLFPDIFSGDLWAVCFYSLYWMLS